MTQVEMSIHVGEWESSHVLATVLLFMGKSGVVFGCIRLEDVQALEFVLHFIFDLAQTLESGLFYGFVDHFNVFVLFINNCTVILRVKRSNCPTTF